MIQSKQQLTIPFLSRINDDDEKQWLKTLQTAMPSYNIVRLSQLNDIQKQDIEVAIVANPDPNELSELPNLKWIHSLWAGVENLVHELPNESIEIVRMNDPMLATTMAEAALAWTFYLYRKMPHYQRQQTLKIWQSIDIKTVTETTVGLLGLGNLGKAAALKLVQQGFKVCGWSRSQVEIEGVESFYGLEEIREVIRKSSILIVLLPLTTETNNLLDESTLSHLPVGASIINFARSRIINSKALVTLLDNDHIDHAVLDVFDTEPLPQESLFWAHPNVTVLPHISAPTNYQTAAIIVATNIANFIATGKTPTSVNRNRGY